MKTYFIRAEVLTLSMPDGEIDVDVDIYEMQAKDQIQALEFLNALLNRRGDWGATGVHAAQVIGCQEDTEVETALN